MKVNLVEEFVLDSLVAGVMVQESQALLAVELLLDDARESFWDFHRLVSFWLVVSQEICNRQVSITFGCVPIDFYGSSPLGVV